MKIRNKLSILFTALTATILLVFAALIYYSAYKNRETEFYNSLKKEAITKANLFLTAKVDATTLQTIYRNNRETLNEVEAAIYDTSFNLLYHDAADIDFVKETRQMIHEVQSQKEIRFYQERSQVIGLLFHHNEKNYIIIVAAYDQYGYNKLNNLSKTILIVFICSILLIYVAGQFFSRKALLPVREMVTNVKEITATNLDLRINNNNGKDELSELANTFNAMLDRLEKSFEGQKQFVSNISHELRTPLAAIITELELSTNKERSLEEYKSVIQNSLSDAQKLAKLSNSLLDFAKASYDPSEISFRKVRIDEILLDARQQVQRQHTDYHIDIRFEKEFESDNAISVNGNEYLLKVAFANLMENACKFSENHKNLVSISFNTDLVTLKFSDNGLGISKEDIQHIFTPFYRGSNKKYAEGNGIGLSLTQKIIKLHNGSINVFSDVQTGTVFTIGLPHT